MRCDAMCTTVMSAVVDSTGFMLVHRNRASRPGPRAAPCASRAFLAQPVGPARGVSAWGAGPNGKMCRGLRSRLVLSHAAMCAPDPMLQPRLPHRLPLCPLIHTLGSALTYLFPSLGTRCLLYDTCRAMPYPDIPCRTLPYPTAPCRTEHTCDDLRVGQLGAAMWDRDGRVRALVGGYTGLSLLYATATPLQREVSYD